MISPQYVAIMGWNAAGYPAQLTTDSNGDLNVAVWGRKPFTHAPDPIFTDGAGDLNVALWAANAGAPVAVIADAGGRLIVSPPTNANAVQALILDGSGDNLPPPIDGLVTHSLMYGLSDGGTWYRIHSQVLGNDNFNSNYNGFLKAAVYGLGYKGSDLWDRLRISNVFHTVLATAAGVTPVWTPTVGLKFRLMGYSISVAGTLAAPGTLTMQLLDGAAVIANHLTTLPSVIATGAESQIFNDKGQGQLSAVVNNVLSINLSAALTSGAVGVNVWGMEE